MLRVHCKNFQSWGRHSSCVLDGNTADGSKGATAKRMGSPIVQVQPTFETGLRGTEFEKPTSNSQATWGVQPKQVG